MYYVNQNIRLYYVLQIFLSEPIKATEALKSGRNHLRINW